MTQRQREVNHGPSWYDVLEHLENLRLVTGRYAVVELTETAGKGVEGKLYVRVVSWSGWNGGTRVGEVGRGSVWPHTDHKTMPALILKLIYDLDSHFAREEREALRQAKF